MNTNYETAIKDLEAELEKLAYKTDGLKFAIETLRSHANVNGHSIPAEGAKSALIKKNLFNEEDTTLTPAERVDLVYKTLSNIGRYAKIKEIVNNLNSLMDYGQTRGYLGNLYREGRVAKVQVTTSNEDTFYGLSEWNDGNSIKPDRMYDKKDLVGRTMK